MAQQNVATKALTPQQQKVANFKGIINTKDMVKRLTSSLGSKEVATQFMSSMIELYSGDTYLQNCDPNMVVMECIKAANLGLPIVKSLGYAYVVPFKNKPTFIIGYKGMIQLAQRSGQYKCINADAIYEGEEVTFDRLSGRLKIDGTRLSDKTIGFFAYFQLVNGFEKTLYMTIDQVTDYAKKYSPSYGTASSPWTKEFDSMAKKTVLRQILKYGPMSTEMRYAEKTEIEAAERLANAEAEENANKGNVIDIPEQDIISVDSSTGEVVETIGTVEETAKPLCDEDEPF